MFDDMNVIVHVCDCPVLGGPRWKWRQKNVSAPFWRLYWNRRPGAWVKVGAAEWELNPRTVFLMAPGTVYSTRAETETEHFYIHFSVGMPLSAVAPGFFPLPDRALTVLAEEALAEFESDRESWRTAFRVDSLIKAALLRLPPGAVPPLPQYDARIQRVLTLMDSRNDLSNAELAAYAGMSRNSFIALFAGQVGEAPQAWFRRRRLERACSLLHFSSATVEEIAAAAGFCDRYHFSRVFKLRYGVGPAEYRRQALLLQQAGRRG